MSKWTQALSVVFTSAFAGGCLLISTVLVPSWRKRDPEVALEKFSEDAPRLGLTMLPLSAAGTVFTGVALAGTLRRKSDSRLPWGLSALSNVAILALLPVYFGGANSRLLNRTQEVEVGTELVAWQRWQWRRTALAVAAATFGAWGLRQGKG